MPTSNTRYSDLRSNHAGTVSLMPSNAAFGYMTRNARSKSSASLSSDMMTNRSLDSAASHHISKLRT